MYSKRHLKYAFKYSYLKYVTIPSLCVANLYPKPSSDPCNVYNQYCEPQETKDDSIPLVFNPIPSQIC